MLDVAKETFVWLAEKEKKKSRRSIEVTIIVILPFF
jgi:hypothetical protein